MAAVLHDFADARALRSRMEAKVMEWLRRSLAFGLLLVVAAALPVTGQTPIKKILYQAKIKVGVTGVGAAQLTVRPSGIDYFAFTHAYPNQEVTKVSLKPEGGAWELKLCEMGNLVGDCTYDTDGNLLIDGPITQTMMMLAQIDAKTLNDALRNGTLWVYLNDTLASGVFVRFM